MKKDIFIVDDDPIYRMIVSRMLKQKDKEATIHECKNGEVGLDQLQYIEKTDSLTIILLDINMPMMDGWTFLEELKASNCYDIRNLNLYMVSSSTDQSDIYKAHQYKIVKKFIHKPLSIHNIQSILEETKI